MVDLYEYGTATEEECIDDLRETISNLSWVQAFTDLEALERKGQRIQYIAQRLKELGGDENE